MARTHLFTGCFELLQNAFADEVVLLSPFCQILHVCCLTKQNVTQSVKLLLPWTIFLLLLHPGTIVRPSVCPNVNTNTGIRVANAWIFRSFTGEAVFVFKLRIWTAKKDRRTRHCGFIPHLMHTLSKQNQPSLQVSGRVAVWKKTKLHQTTTQYEQREQDARRQTTTAVLLLRSCYDKNSFLPFRSIQNIMPHIEHV